MPQSFSMLLGNLTIATKLRLMAAISTLVLIALSGYLLAEDIADTRWVVDEPGARIIFPNPKVKNGLRAGLLVVPVAAE